MNTKNSDIDQFNQDFSEFIYLRELHVNYRHVQLHVNTYTMFKYGDMLAKLITTKDMMWSLPCP